MPINLQLLDYITVTNPQKLNGGMHPKNKGTDLHDTLHSIDVRIGDKYAQVEPITRRQGYTDIGKFHISVADEDIPKAWNLITSLLADEGLSTKVMTLGGRVLVANGGTQPDAAGKNIVIFFDQAEAQDKAKFEKVLTKIERLFEENDIQTGPKVVTDKPIPGSRFSYMRYGNTEYDKRTGKALRDKTPPPQTPMDDIVIPPGPWASRMGNTPGSSSMDRGN